MGLERGVGYLASGEQHSLVSWRGMSAVPGLSSWVPSSLKTVTRLCKGRGGRECS